MIDREEGNTKQIKQYEKLEEEIKEKYGLYSVIVVDKQYQRHSTTPHVPEKLLQIVNAVFNQITLDHYSYAKEDGKHVIYTEPYRHVDIKQIDIEKAKKYDVDIIPLKRSLHDEATYPYKIIISNPGDLRKSDSTIGYRC